MPRRETAAETRQAGVRGDRHLQHDAVLPPILRDVADAECELRRRASAMRTGSPPQQDLAGVAGARPKSVSANSVRPDPTSPAMPRISPRAPHGSRERRRRQPRVPARRRRCGTARFGNIADISRPTISRISSRAIDVAHRAACAIDWPSRSTVTRSAMGEISSRRCEM